MSRNHARHAETNWQAYQGDVRKIESSYPSTQKWSVVEAANYYDLPPILYRYGVWAICEDGINCLYRPYVIPKHRFDEPDWIEQVTEKTWVNQQDFIKVLRKAKQMLASGDI